MTSLEERKAVSYFAPGPCGLPTEVMVEAQNEFISYRGSGVAPMELSHRGKDFDSIIRECESNLRDILAIPDNYKVLFLSSGGTGQFAAVPLNLLPEGGSADYVVTGTWSQKASAEAKKYGEIHCIAKPDKFVRVPDLTELPESPAASYLYYCDNETVHGVEFKDVPLTEHTLVCDMSSNFLTRPVDVAKFGLIFAGVQKNVGPPGLAIVIVRDDLLGSTRAICPAVLDYKLMADNRSLYNTPPTYNIYMSNLMFRWIKKQGGLEYFDRLSKDKSQLLYDLIDSTSLYHSIVEKPSRSRVNVVFRVGRGNPDEAMEEVFIAEATDAGLLSIKGHRSVGGIRVSTYNSVTMDDVRRLVAFMATFASKHQ